MDSYHLYFNCRPDEEFTNKLLSCYASAQLGDEVYIDTHNFEARKTITRLNKLIPDLTLYYKPKKAESMLPVMNNRAAVVILRHYLSQVGYKLELVRKDRKPCTNSVYVVVKKKKDKDNKFVVKLFD